MATTMREITERSVLVDIQTGAFIGGSWRGTEASFDVVDPATEEVLTRVADAGPEAGLAALTAAAAAQDEWGRTVPRMRAEILRNAF